MQFKILKQGLSGKFQYTQNLISTETVFVSKVPSYLPNTAKLKLLCQQIKHDFNKLGPITYVSAIGHISSFKLAVMEFFMNYVKFKNKIKLKKNKGISD